MINQKYFSPNQQKYLYIKVYHHYENNNKILPLYFRKINSIS